MDLSVTIWSLYSVITLYRTNKWTNTLKKLTHNTFLGYILARLLLLQSDKFSHVSGSSVANRKRRILSGIGCLTCVKCNELCPVATSSQQITMSQLTNGTSRAAASASCSNVSGMPVDFENPVNQEITVTYSNPGCPDGAQVVRTILYGQRVAWFATHAYTMPNRKQVVYGMGSQVQTCPVDIEHIGHRPQSRTQVGRPAGRAGSGHKIYKY